MKFIIFATLAVIVGAMARPQDTGGSLCSNGRSTANAQCCVWFDVLDNLQAGLYQGSRCGIDCNYNGYAESPVRKVIRIAFHDAIGISSSLTAAGQFGGGGADGSIISHSDVELTFAANGGLGATVDALRAVGLQHGVSFGDLIQFAAAVGESNCPGAPQLEFLAGRSNASQASPPGLVPGPADSVTTILSRMADGGLSADDTVDLLAAHSISSQENLNANIFRSPLDSTPQVLDSQFYIETSLKGTIQSGPNLGFAEVLSPIQGEFRMSADNNLARDPRTSCRWQEMATNNALVRTRHRAAMAKMAVLGFDLASLTDCSDVIPVPAALNALPSIPPGLTQGDLDNSCPTAPFPNLPVAPGPAITVAPAVTLIVQRVVAGLAEP
ncbi:heme peroxidase [Coprinopsis marcescibilis]|uniref:Peroxidase n=1 Tax=Coprinopsis marcescibilis TaxID=230819 RepID=A0A5C3KSR4_COPMA|nr:heme peroxidase [Coprinopsis marcescibilis]